MKKKLMILLVAVLFVTMMFSTGCKKKFDITGVWTLNYFWNNEPAVKTDTLELSSVQGMMGANSSIITFTGDKKSGTFQSESNTGTYTVDGKNVRWIFSVGTTYTGTATDDNNMSGTMISYMGMTGTWICTR